MIAFRSSPIHGIGGFALNDIPPATRVLEYVGERISKQESLRRCQSGNPFNFYLNSEWDLDGNVTFNPARGLNHSCSPNCEARLLDAGIWMVAKRLIQTGEEITFDYGYDLIEFRDHPCHCGAPECFGYIVAEDLRRREAG